MYTSEVFDGLRKVFTYVGYPAILLAVFGVIALRMRALFAEHRGYSLMQWRLAVAGLLPLTVLTFVVVGELPGAVVWMPTADQWKLQIILGALVTLGTLEASLHVSGDKLALSFMLYLSSLGTGLLYVVMEGALARFQPAVFTVVVMGGLHFVFRDRDPWEGGPVDLWDRDLGSQIPSHGEDAR